MSSHSPSLYMATLMFITSILLVPSSNARNRPSPGYSPSSKFNTIHFNQGFKNLWGPQHQKLDQDTLTLWLDKTSGSGFKSLHPYRSGYFGASMKLHPGYTAGVITSFYLSNNQEHPGDHDEIDIEFLGRIPNETYVLQTNVFARGSGDRTKAIGREMQFHLWFDPTKDFHNYAILWTPQDIIFLVDDVPIRRYPRKNDATFPTRPLWIYGSIWDASAWATDHGRFKANYTYQPFIGRYRNFKVAGCTVNAPASCRPPSVSPPGSLRLSPQQNSALQYVQSHYLVYNYCRDPSRDHTQTPEC